MEDNIVRSSIPLRLPQAERALGIASEDNDTFDSDEDTSSRIIPYTITWRGGGQNVFLAGTFHEDEWRARERLRYE